MLTVSTGTTKSVVALALTVPGVSLSKRCCGTVRLAVAGHLVHAVDGTRTEVLAVRVSLQTHGVGGVPPPGDVMVRVPHQGRQLVRVRARACRPTRVSEECANARVL